MKNILFAFLFLPLMANAQTNKPEPAPFIANEDYNLDIFIGSIEMRGKELILKRCDLGGSIYLLKPSPKAKENLILKLKKSKLSKDNETTLLAHYVEINGQYGLEVFKIDEIIKNRSCHLMDVLK